MRRIVALYLFTAWALLLTASPAFAHGSGDTVDGPDAGDSIQVYVGARLARHPGFWQGISEWNDVPGPRLVRVLDSDDAEVRAYQGHCTYLGEPFYGGTFKRINGIGHLCLSAHNADGTVHDADWYRKAALHEFGHGYGMPHHFCDDPVSIMTVCNPKRVGYLTEHDRAYKRSL